MRTSAIVAFAAATLAGAASAQTIPAAKPATPDQIATARVEGDALLAAARAQDLFDNEAGLLGTADIVLRHRASGFVCLFDPGQRLNSVIVYPNPRRGDDVGCNTMTTVGDRTTNFTRDAHSDEATLSGAAMAIQGRIPGAQPAPPPQEVTSFVAKYPNVPTPLAARFVTDNTLEEVVSAHVGGWLVEDRFTAPRAFVRNNALDQHWYFTVGEGLKHRLAPQQALGASARPTGGPPIETVANGVAIARSEGDRLLAGNHTDAMFENITGSDIITLRHRESGLICRFDLASSKAVVVGGWPGGSTRPDAINCLRGIGSLQEALTILRNTDHLTVDEALAGAVAATRGFHANLRPYAGPSADVKADPSLPPHRVARLANGPGGDAFYVYVSAAVVGDWIVGEQIAGPAPQASTADLVGEASMMTAINDLLKAKSRRPATTPPAPMK